MAFLLGKGRSRPLRRLLSSGGGGGGEAPLTAAAVFSGGRAACEPRRHIALIDVSALVFRSFFALSKNGLARRDGRHTSALYGYCTAVLGVFDHLRPTHVMACMDSRAATFRHRMYPEYKAHRPPVPPPLAWQLRRVEALTRAMGINPVLVDGYEADDVIGTAALRAREEGFFEVTVVSPDKDFMQLLRPGIKMVKTTRAAAYEATVAADTPRLVGVEPAQVVDYLALVGDAADNVPGARGVGPKRAAALLQRYGTLQGVFAAEGQAEADGLSRTEATSLRLACESRDAVELSRRLVEIDTDVPGLPPLESLRFGGFRAGEGEPLADALQDLGMVRTLQRFRDNPEFCAGDP